MARTFKLPPVEFRIKGRAALAFDEASQSFTLISHFSSKHWVKTFRVTTRTTIPTDVGEALSLRGNREIASLMRTLSSALAPDRVMPRAGVDPPVPIPLIDAMPDQLLIAAGSMALPMMFVAVCNYFGLPPVDLNREIDIYTGTLRRALKDNLGVAAPGREPETKDHRAKRLSKEKAKWIKGIQEAEQKWYASGKRRIPKQKDLALIIFGNQNSESAATMFSKKMKKHGLRIGSTLSGGKPESEHFVVHFALINPPTGRTAASDGVKDRSLVRTYLDALERCYEVMTSEPWIREPPIVGPQGKTAVFVVDSAPFTSTDLQMVPYICLPSDNNEPTNKAELDRAAAEAVHEAVHIFNYRERPFHDSYSGAWEWYDCALASFVETIVLPENVDYLRFVDDWIRKPESPLDELDIKNQGFVFIQYLANRMGLDFVNRVWTEALQKESPLDAIARTLPNEQRFVSHEPHHKDIFGSGYCMDSYFFDDSSSKCYMPRAFERYGSRAVAESVLLGGEDTKTITDSIDHLACKYYRLCLKDGVQKKQIRIYLNTAGSAAPLKAEATVVKSNGQRLFTESLRMKPAEDATGGEQLISNISLSSSDTDHVILVVSNCGLRSAQNADEHDDNRKFEIIVSAT